MIALDDLVSRVVRQRMTIEQVGIPPVRVYLAGDRDQWVEGADRARGLGIEVVGIISDSDEESLVGGVPVLRRKRLPSHLPYPLLFVGSPKKHQFSRSSRYNQQVLWLDGTQVRKLRSRLADPDLLVKRSDHLREFYLSLADDASRETLLSVIASRIHDDNGYLRIADYDEYRHPTVRVEVNDVVVDCGAHVGKVSRSFAKCAGNGGHVYAFEPDPGNAALFLQRNSDLPQVELVQSGVWDRPDTLYFDNSSSSSAGFALREGGSSTVSVTSLDVFFSDGRRRAPKVIKLDVEGAELKAIEGSTQIITEFKPKLMVSVYHKPDDIWSLALKIKSIRPDYKLYLGHHNYYHTETDLYCV